jgi:hypothetical protein
VTRGVGRTNEVERLSAMGIPDAREGTQFPLSLLFGPGRVPLVLVAVATVAYGAAHGVGCITSDTCPGSLPNCNDDRNVRSSCIVPNTAQSQVQLHSQLEPSNTAFGTKSLGPIRNALGSRPGSLPYNPGSRVVGPVASPARSLTSGPGSLDVTPGSLAERDASQVRLAGSPAPGPFSVIHLLTQSTVGLVAQDSGLSLPQRGFESHTVLQFPMPCLAQPGQSAGGNALEVVGSNPIARPSWKFSSAVEHRPDKPGVVGSNPSTSTKPWGPPVEGEPSGRSTAATRERAPGPLVTIRPL